ncbi:cysteine desulfurase family protein [Mesobacillus zeae]|uniref:Cysteine desulfurase n=1 Tax=Mesobacillus zeae TaxID=1917180 RepID=A0A398AXD1_9BACI|nr:cysteine desulfurase family protein [Mesobacillus zeae]RID82221.1 cysteine desulfurase [Mesobacillus zeae]
MKIIRTAYLDNNATTPLDPRVVESMMPFYLTQFGNPSSLYSLGREAKSAIEDSRIKIADTINAKPQEIIFTSGGSESNSTVFMNLLSSISPKKRHIIVSKVEHPAILQACEYLAKHFGVEVTYIEVDEFGVISYEQFENSIREDTCLVSIMFVNNEVGSIQPVEKIGQLCKEHNIHFHCDAVQAVGKVPIDVSKLNVTSLALSAHKICGPKGVGALYISESTRLSPLIHGGGQEFGFRSGTENVSGIVGLGKAAEISIKNHDKFTEHSIHLKSLFFSQLREHTENWFENSSDKTSVPSTMSIYFEGIRGESLAHWLNHQQVFVSIGSACSSSSKKLSHVLSAMGKDEDMIRSTLRFSVAMHTTEQEVLYAAEMVCRGVQKLRQMSPKKSARVNVQTPPYALT